MIKNVFFCLLILTTKLSNAQNDSIKINYDRVLVKGIYKTYQEFLDNRPSIQVNFFTTLIRAGKSDSSIIAGKSIKVDSVRSSTKIWGFCDGNNVFVYYSGTLFEKRYWKLQCKGPNPYFYYLNKDVIGGPSIFGLVTLATMAALPPSVELMIISKTGKPQYALHKNLKKLLRDNPILYQEVKKETIMPDSLRRRYVIRYNEAIMN